MNRLRFTIPPRVWRTIAAVWALTQVAGAASAQDVPLTPLPSSTFELGPLGLTPSFEISSFGVDTNVFRTTTDQKSDYVGTALARLETVFQARRLTLLADGAITRNFFRRYSELSTMGGGGRAHLRFSFGSFEPFVESSYSSGRQRPSLEVDLLMKHSQADVGAGVEVALGAFTRLRFTGTQLRFDYQDDGYDEAGNEEALEQARLVREGLNRTELHLNLTAQHEITPLTSVTLAGGYDDYRFTFLPIRDGTSAFVAPGVTFADGGLFRGGGSAGYRRLDLNDPTAPDFSGLIGSTDLEMVLFGRLRLRMRAARDFFFSRSDTQPYYVETTITGFVSFAVNDRLELGASTGRAHLQYSAVRDGVDPGVARDSELTTPREAAIILRLNTHVRAELRGEFIKRHGEQAPERGYEGNRIYTVLAIR
jgi:hypothetical protein